MHFTASQLRQTLYQLLDQVLESGVPLEVERNGRRLRIISADGPPKLERVVEHEDYVVGDPEELVHVDWSNEWRP